MLAAVRCDLILMSDAGIKECFVKPVLILCLFSYVSIEHEPIGLEIFIYNEYILEV